MVHAAALETGSSSAPATATTTGARRRDAKRQVAAENRAEFLAAREARLADAEVIHRRGLDNGTVTSTELDTSKWATSTLMATAPASTAWVTQEVETSVTTTATSTFWSGVTKVVVTVTAVRLLDNLRLTFHLLTSFYSPRLPRPRPSTPSSRPRLQLPDAQPSQLRSRQRPLPARLSARQREASLYKRPIERSWVALLFKTNKHCILREASTRIRGFSVCWRRIGLDWL